MSSKSLQMSCKKTKLSTNDFKFTLNAVKLIHSIHLTLYETS